MKKPPDQGRSEGFLDTVDSTWLSGVLSQVRAKDGQYPTLVCSPSQAADHGALPVLQPEAKRPILGLYTRTEPIPARGCSHTSHRTHLLTGSGRATESLEAASLWKQDSSASSGRSQRWGDKRVEGL